MNCRDLSSFLDDYLAGDLPDTVAGEFQVHVDRCGNCHKYLVQYRETVALGRASAADLSEPPEELIQAIMASLKTAE